MQNEDLDFTLPKVTAASRSPEAVGAFGFGEALAFEAGSERPGGSPTVTADTLSTEVCVAFGGTGAWFEVSPEVAC